MKGYVDGINWLEYTPMKYWSPPASYSDEKRKKEVTEAIFAKNYIGSMKIDGYWERLIKDEDGNCFMISRELKDKYGWCPHLQPLYDSMPNGSVLTCEIYFPGNEGSKNITTILGCLKEKAIERQNKGAKLHAYIFDICAWNGKNLIKMPAANRFNFLENTIHPMKYVEVAHYLKGQELWDALQQYLADGREGIVITNPSCIIYDKRTPAHMTIKVKKELEQTIDCFIIGANPPTQQYGGEDILNWKYWYNEKTGEKLNGEYYKNMTKGEPLIPLTKAYYNGWAGSLKLGMYTKDGKVIQIGNLSGLTEEVLSNWREYVSKVCEINGMEIFPDTHAVRHPRLKCWRDDKIDKECVFEDIFS